MRKFEIISLLGLLLATLGLVSRAADSASQSGAYRIPDTQLTLRIGRFQGRATVIAIDKQVFTIVTAAHFLAADDVGKTIFLRRPEGNLIGQLVSVTRNPNFHPTHPRNADESSVDGAVGVDSAVAAIEVKVHNDAELEIFRRVRAAELTVPLHPGRPSQILSVHIVDQAGEEHVVRAGNHLNPQCLAWGRRSYYPRPGDSGSGVFAIKKMADGTLVPILIGNVSQTDDRGGIATLVHRNAPWVEKAILRPHAEVKAPPPAASAEGEVAAAPGAVR